MKVKVFDESHEKDLEEAINKFISEEEPEIMDIKFRRLLQCFLKNRFFAFPHL